MAVNQQGQAFPFRAIVLLTSGLSLAALNGALMKILSGSASEIFIVWARYLGFFIVMIPVMLFMVKGESLKPVRPFLQVLRAATIAFATVSFVIGAKTTDFADSIAIIYIYPFLLTLMAPWLLGEKVPLAAWLGVIGGFCGVLLVAKPDFNGLETGAVFTLLCGVLVSFHLVLNRKLAPLANPLITSMWGALLATLILSLFVPFAWRLPIGNDWWLVVGVALLSALSQSLTLMAFARAQASTLAPFSYAEIISAVVIGLALFGTLPDLLAWLGMVLIVGSGILVAQAPRLGALVSRRRQPPL